MSHKAKVVVTGANGFLGLHLVTELLKQGFNVVAMVRENSDKTELEKLSCQIVIADILDLPELRKAFSEADGVFHVAGAMSASPKDKKRLYEVNVEGTRNVIAAAIQMKIKKLIHVSSVVAVGVNLSSLEKPLNEESVNITREWNFANYDTKRMGEELVLDAVKSDLIDATVVNPGLIYGPGDAKKIIRKGNVLAAKGKLPFYTSGGVNIVSVYDVTQAMIQAYKKGKKGERYLLTGDNITIKQLLTTISDLAGAPAPKKELPTKVFKFIGTVMDGLGFKSELNRENIVTASSFHWYDHSKAKRDLDFNPRGYHEALKSSVEWMKSNHYLEKK